MKLMPRNGARQPRRWRNWSGSHRVTPQEIVHVTSTSDIEHAVARATRARTTLRPVGSGHSFSAVAVAPNMQLELSDFTGITAIDRKRKRKRVTVRSGTKLWQIPRLIAPLGLAMQNLGDINRQSILGAISTSTHGTGLQFGGLGSQVVGLTIVTGNGSTLTVDESDPALLDALRVSLGAYGVVTEVTLQLVDDFDLHTVETLTPLGDVLNNWRALSEEYDHFEYFWFGHADRVITKRSNRVAPNELPRTPGGTVSEFVSDEVIGNAAFAAICQAGKFMPAAVPALNRISTVGWGESARVKHWSDGFASPRRVRFFESEFAVPFDAVPDVIAELRDLFRGRGEHITFPIEVRSAAADSAWLATNHGRETGYVAVHQHIGSDYRDYFSRAQTIFAKYAGRPHWGKMHPFTAKDLAGRYPYWDESLTLRNEFDPNRIFANDYLRQVFGD